MSRSLPRPQVFVTGEIERISRCWPCQVIAGSWRVQLGSTWTSHGGVTHGDIPMSQTHYFEAVFNEPIDLNLSFSSPENWPRIFIQLHKISRFGKFSLGEVAILLPNVPGRHRLKGRMMNGSENTVDVHLNVEIVFAHLKSNGVATNDLDN